MKGLALQCVATLVFLLIATGAYAQGTIRGVVTDSLTGETLPGANVYLLDTALGAATDVEGSYRIGGVPAGTYTMRVSFLGYQTIERPVTVERGETVVENVALRFNVLEGQEIIVLGQLEGQAAAINQQLTSNTIVNVVSEEKIQELPDANAAEAIGRLPGVAIQRSGGEANKVVLRGLSDKFTSITVDGVRIAATDADARGVDLSTISQGSLAGIELYKALTPDKDADAIAGSVNLVTKKAPSARLLRFDARGAYSDLNDTFGQYDFVARYGERFFNERLGVQLIGNLEQRDRSKEYYDLSYDLGLSSGTDYRITDVDLNFTDETRTRQGASLLLDLDTPDGGTIRLNNIYNQTSRDFIDYTRNYPTDGSELFYGARNREQSIYTFNSALRGENYLMGMTTTWGASFAHSQSDYPFDFDITFTEPSATDSEGNPISGMGRIPGNLQKGPPEAISEFALNNFEQAYFYTAFYRGEESNETEMTAYLDLARNYTLGRTMAGELKVGGKYRQKARDRERSELLSPYYIESFPQYVRGEDGTIRQKSFEGTPFENTQYGDPGRQQLILVTNLLDQTPEGRDIFDDFNLYPLINRDLLRSWWDINRHGFSDQSGRNPEFERNLEADAFFYDITERVAAGYVMNTFNFGQTATLLAGVRVEREDNDYNSRYSPKDLSGFPVPSGSIRDTTASHREIVWLPNAHLTFRPTDFLNIRLAAYKALARPDFNQRLASFVARKAGTFYPGNSLFVGNPDLKAAEAWNFEINTSVYSNTIGLFTVSAFYKDIKDMYHVINGVPFDAASADSLFEDLGVNVSNPFQGQQFALTYPYNSSQPTRVWGLELEHQMSFRFLPGLLRNIVLNYNLSVIRSTTYIPGTELEEVPRPPLPPTVRYVFVEREQKMEGQPELLGNVAVGYDIGGFSARLSVFHQGEYNTVFSASGRDDRVVNSFTRWDLALKQQMFDNLSLMFNLNNITGVEEGTTVLNRVNGWRLRNDSETYGLTANLGLRLTL